MSDTDIMSDIETVDNPMFSASSDKSTMPKDRTEVIADAIKSGNKIDENSSESFVDILNGTSLEKFGIYPKRLLPNRGNEFTDEFFFVEGHKYVFYARGSPGYLLPITCFNVQDQRCSSKGYKININVRPKFKDDNDFKGVNEYYIVDGNNMDVDGNMEIVFGDVWKICNSKREQEEKVPSIYKGPAYYNSKPWLSRNWDKPLLHNLGGNQNTKDKRKSNKKHKQRKTKKQRKSRK
jgi:hypothetical protein